METTSPVDWVAPEPVPIKVWPGGSVRIGNSRVGFDLIVHHFNEGRSPEDIVRDYDTLKLPDVYGAIAYYLRHREEVDAWLKKLDEETEARRIAHEAKFPPLSKAELLKRREALERAHASAGG